MNDQLRLDLGGTCACGCGLLIQHSDGPGRPALYATPACRVRAHRRRVTKTPPAPDTDQSSATPAVTASAAPADESDRPAGGHFTTCRSCGSPDLYVTACGVGICPRCGHQPARRA